MPLLRQVHQKARRMGDSLALALMLCVSVFVLILAYRSVRAVPLLAGWEAVLFKAMLYYLSFVALRTGLLLLFSFADRFFQRRLPTISSFPLVSIIVPCFNEAVVIRQVLNSLLHIDYPNFEIIVVDDGSTDDTLLEAKAMEQDGKIRVVYQKNGGKAEALNRGVSEALGEYVLNIDADSVLAPTVIRVAMPYFKNDPRVAAVAGNVQIGNTGANLLTRFQRLEYTVGLNFHKSAQSFLSMVTIVPGPIGLFRRSAILEVGGYRTSTFAEDCDLTIRLLLAGYQTVYCPAMIARTEAPEDFESLLKQRYRWSRGMIQAIRENSWCLFRPWKDLRKFSVIAYMVLETIVIPTANFIFALLFVEHAVLSGRAVILGPFFIQLTVLDLILTTYAVMSEPEALSLVVLSTVNRLTYGLSMEVLRFFSILDELIGLPMNWNKLVRKGL
jgi:biofilm PGA synthesis N-glycosyltransferase PgaC